MEVLDREHAVGTVAAIRKRARSGIRTKPDRVAGDDGRGDLAGYYGKLDRGIDGLEYQRAVRRDED